MCNQECARSSLVVRIEQLQLHQQGLIKYMAAMERRLDDLSERFNNRPERNQPASLQDTLTQLHGLPDLCSAHRRPVEVLKQLPESAPWVDEIQPQAMQVQFPEYQLVFDRSGSRAVLMSALEKALHRLIIVCPWLSRNSIDADLIQKFRDCLNRNCRIDIGWGYLNERGKTGKGFGNNAIRDLKQLEQDYPGQFKLKLLGTHEKFLVCDDSFAMLGSHNMLTSNAQSITREVGIRTTDSNIIQGLINRFDGAEGQKANAIDESLTAGWVSLDDAEILDVQDIGEEPNTILVNPDGVVTDQDVDDSTEDGNATPINTKQFLRRYNEKERDFTKLNLFGINLSGKSFEPDAYNLKLNEANLSETNLSKTKLENASFIQANLNKANLSEANLWRANFIAANLSEANLMQANLSAAKLAAADLNGAVLTAANLTEANLSGANLSKSQLKDAQFYKTDLSGANLSKAQLGNTDFNKTNLSGANITGVNLVGVTFNNTDLSGAILVGAKLCGADLNGKYLRRVNLTNADLRGANLQNANLENANLTGANLGGANLNGAKLSGAIMPDGTVHA